MLDDSGRPRYGRAYADQLKQDLADEMERRRAENEMRMRRLREQFKDQNKQIEEASSGAPRSRPVLCSGFHASCASAELDVGGRAGCRSKRKAGARAR